MSKLGINMVKTMGRIKHSMDLEPKLSKGPDNLLSNDWVEWHIRQTGVPRKIAINRGYHLLDSKGKDAVYDGIRIDEGLAVLGINRLADYFFHTRSLTRHI